MATSNTTTRECATCMQNSDGQKVKPGITLCDGCNEMYCLSHFIEHRQELNKKLNDIAEQRDILRSHIAELSTKMPNETLKKINDWEKMMVQMIIEAADNARQQVHQIIVSEMERECIELTSKITSFRINEDYFETDIEALQAKMEQLDEELNDLSSLHRIQLNLPTLDCTNIVHTKAFETHSLPETTKGNNSVILKPKVEYRSFLQRFLTTHRPSNDLETRISGYACASPTMLIDITNRTVTRLVFNRQSTSTFEWKHGPVLAIRWSLWFQQFIVLTNQNVVVVDAVEKESQVVVEEKHTQLQCMSSWNHLCLISDNEHRVFLYQTNQKLAAWLLLYCWSVPTTCRSSEAITAIGLNKQHIVLSIQCDDQYRFSIHKLDMTHCSDVQLTYPFATVRALPQGEWLLYNSSEKQFYVIDSELEQHNEPYLSAFKDSEISISCEETDKILVVFLSRKTGTKIRTQSRIRVYTKNC